MLAYKFTDVNLQTYNKTQWEPGVIRTATGNGPLCTSGWIHAYSHPLVAVFMNLIHGDFKEDSILWECEVNENIYDDSGLKFGTIQCVLIKQIEKPTISIEQRIRIAIKCAYCNYKASQWATWANNWLQNINRTAHAAHAAAYAVHDAANAAASAAYAAAYAANAAAYAANAATYAANDAAHAAHDAADFNILECIEWGMGTETEI